MPIQIPTSLDQAISSLNGLAALLTAKQWERAAIVYAFTTDEINGSPRTAGKSPQLSAREFAEQGIAGLAYERTVREYRRAWKAAIAAGKAKEVRPGDAVETPDLPWKEYFGETSADADERAFRRVVEDPDRFREALRDKPETVVTLAERVVQNPSVRTLAEARLAEPVRERDYVAPPAPRPVDYSDEFRAAVNKLIPILHAIRDGRWEPDPADRALAAFLGRAFQEIVSGEATADLFAEIDAFLATQESRR